MPLVTPGIPEYDYLPDSPPAIIADLDQTGLTVYVRIFKDAAQIPIANSGAIEIGNTGSYLWSTSGLPPIDATRAQYYYMFDGGGSNIDEGQFILKTPEMVDKMPSLRDHTKFRKNIL